jgi:xanthine/uracil/vitamin C permease (AzgA family)
LFTPDHGGDHACLQALSAVFVEGWIFVLLTITGVRGRIMEMIPKNIMYATSAGERCMLFQMGAGAGYDVRASCMPSQQVRGPGTVQGNGPEQHHV